MHWKSGRAYSQDLRDKVFVSVDAGVSVRETSRRFEVSVSYIYKALSRRRDLGEVGVRQSRGRPPRKLERHAEAIRTHLAANSDTTLRKLRSWLASAHGIEVSVKAVWSEVHRLGLTLKKSPQGGRAGSARRRAAAPALADLAALSRP